MVLQLLSFILALVLIAQTAQAFLYCDGDDLYNTFKIDEEVHNISKTCDHGCVNTTKGVAAHCKPDGMTVDITFFLVATAMVFVFILALRRKR
jgi:hypothetical protein